MGDGGQTKGVKKVPEPLRYSPPRIPNSHSATDDHSRHTPPTTNHHHQSDGAHAGHNGGGGGHPAPHANGHSNRNQQPQQHQKPVQRVDPRPDKQQQHHAADHHKPQTETRQFNHQKPALQRRSYDDYDIIKRRQEMDSHGWPDRSTNPKDYLIGGIHGPLQPKNKPVTDVNHHQQQQQSHSPPKGTPPNNKAAVREPHRSRSFPRDNHEEHKNGSNNNNHKKSGVDNDGNNLDRAFSLIDAKEVDDGKAAAVGRRGGRGGAVRGGRGGGGGGGGGGTHSREGHYYDEDIMELTDDRNLLIHDAVFGRASNNRSPTRNGPKFHRGAGAAPRGRLGKQKKGSEVIRPPWNSNFLKPGFDEGGLTSDVINNDGLSSYKARLVTFYKNGDPFFPGAKISMKPGRDFATMENLYNYLTPRTDLPAGVRHIFTTDGVKIRHLDELEDGGYYVCSSRRKFQPLPYGLGKREWKPHSKLQNQEDLKLFRPPSPGAAVVGRERKSPDGQPGSREGRVIRVINNDDHSVQSRILLNLRTSQPWEEVLQDLGQALRLPAAKKLFTYSGQEVQSFSQLRNDFREVDTFYLATGESFGPRQLPETSRSYDEPTVHPRKALRGPPRPGSAPDGRRDLEHNIREPIARGRGRIRNQTKSNSPPLNHFDPVRIKIRGQRKEVYPPLNQRYPRDESPPDKSMDLNWVYGYRGHDTRQNLLLLPTGELLYYVAAVAVLYDRHKNRQRHYIGHTEDIQCMALHPTRELVASGQKEGKGRQSRAQVHVWDVDTLSTQMVIGLNDVENGVISLSFTNGNLGQHLLIIDDSPEHMLSIWNWKTKRLIGKTAINQDKLCGGQFIPKDDTQVITYGELHLTRWKRQKDGGFDRDDLLEEDEKSITCVEFDEEGDQYMLTGDAEGNITVWSDSRTGVYQIVRVVQAHMRAVSAMLMLPDGTLLSSGGNEKDRYIKAWDSNHSYRAITFARLPESAGGVRSLCPVKLDTPDVGIFAGTSKNMILEGSVHRRFKIVVQGHFKQLSALAVDPDEPAFVTAGHDRSISRWAMHKLIWKVQVQSECSCLAIHPMGEVVAVGTLDGHFIILTLHRGMHVATLPASKQVITCMAYSPDGSTLAVALEEGSITLYSVTGRGYAYRRLKILRGHDYIVHMDWSRDGKCIQSVTSDNNNILWDMMTLEMEKIPSTMRDVKWHTVTCTLTYTVHGIWNNGNQMIESMNTTCCASGSEKLLVVGDDEGYVRLYRYPCISPRADFHEMKAQSSKINSVRFLYDDSFVITIGGDDAVLLQWMIVHSK